MSCPAILASHEQIYKFLLMYIVKSFSMSPGYFDGSREPDYVDRAMVLLGDVTIKVLSPILKIFLQSGNCIPERLAI